MKQKNVKIVPGNIRVPAGKRFGFYGNVFIPPHVLRNIGELVVAWRQNRGQHENETK